MSNMTIDAIKGRIHCLQVELKNWQDILEKRSCNDCEHFANGCKLADGHMPPDHVVKQGCPQWEFDGIPF